MDTHVLVLDGSDQERRDRRIAEISVAVTAPHHTGAYGQQQPCGGNESSGVAKLIETWLATWPASSAFNNALIV
jgi:hypothetical protein